jgi:hypothetical protein
MLTTAVGRHQAAQLRGLDLGGQLGRGEFGGQFAQHVGELDLQRVADGGQQFARRLFLSPLHLGEVAGGHPCRGGELTERPSAALPPAAQHVAE